MTLRDELVDRARAGDFGAFDLLIAALPPELPPAIRRAARDAAIRQLANKIAAMLPGASCRRLALILAAAGTRVEAGLHLGGAAAFAGFTSVEAAKIEARISEIVAWAPAGHDGLRWPGRRQVERIIGGGDRAAASRPPVVMTRVSAA